MSKIKDTFKRLEQYLMQAEEPASSRLEPQVGMTWRQVQHFRRPSLNGDKSMMWNRYQIASVDERGVGIIERNAAGILDSGQTFDGNAICKIYSRTEWDELYTKHFRAPRPVPDMVNGGKMVMEYHGILPVPDVSGIMQDDARFWIDDVIKHRHQARLLPDETSGISGAKPGY